MTMEEDRIFFLLHRLSLTPYLANLSLRKYDTVTTSPRESQLKNELYFFFKHFAKIVKTAVRNELRREKKPFML